MDEERQLAPLPGPEARQWAMLCHYAAFFWLLAPMIGNVLGPLVVWQLKKDSDPFVDRQGKEAFNFQLTYSLWMIVSGVLGWIVIGFALAALVNVVALVLVVIAGMRANEGRDCRYPLCWRFVK